MKCGTKTILGGGLLSGIALIALLISNTPSALAETSSTDLNLSISEVISLSLSSPCDISGNLTLNITPTSTGVISSCPQTITVDTNTPGFELYAKVDSTNLTHTSISTASPIPSNYGNTASTLTTNTWGYAIPTTTSTNNNTNGIPAGLLSGFSSTYSTLASQPLASNATAKFKSLATTDTLIKDYEENTYNPGDQTANNNQTTIYYATAADMTATAGQYATTLTYTAIGEVIPEPLPTFKLKALAAGTMSVWNKWTTPIFVNGTSITSNTKIDLSVNVNDIVTVEPLDANTFRSWTAPERAFVGGVNTAIISMPAMNKFTIDEGGAIAGDGFFFGFNNGGVSYYMPGTLVSLPAGSFDTSNITEAGRTFFGYFNYKGLLTALPDGSFNFSKLTTVGDFAFTIFNEQAGIAALPNDSFNISNVTTVGTDFFRGFNNQGKIIELPVGSFDISKITTAPNDFFFAFNFNGSIETLPANSFNTSAITSTGNNFFANFNGSGGKITGLPVNSFNLSSITSTGSNFLYQFNTSGRIPKQTTGSHVEIINKSTSALTAYYWDGTTTVTENVLPGDKMWYAATN